jgi:serine/threonine protein phosphatase PrpC
MISVRFDTAVLSDRGGRVANEDAADFTVLDGFSCWVLADGLGGHAGGGMAAELAVSAALSSFKTDPRCDRETLERCVLAANRAVCDGQGREPRLAEMRSTIVVLVANSSEAMWGHVGDSRLYYFTQGRIQFQTKDHSVPQAMTNAGEITPDQIRHHEDRNRLLRSLGARENLRPAIQTRPQPLEAGDAFLLATDGFWEYVNEIEMENDYARSSNAMEWLKRMQTRLRNRVRGDHDNYSAIGVFVS